MGEDKRKSTGFIAETEEIFNKSDLQTIHNKIRAYSSGS
jgi:hypothetical protein